MGASDVERGQAREDAHGTPVGLLVLADRLGLGAAVLTVAASVCGLVVGGLYRDRAAFADLVRADDVFRLLVVVPVLALGLWAAARGSIVGRLSALGALVTLVYLYGVLAFGAALGAMTIVHIAILGLAFWALLLGLLGLDPVGVERAVGSRTPRRSTAAFLLVMAALSMLQWGATILGSAASGNPPPDVARYGWTTSPLYAIELAFAVPLFAVAGVRLLQGHAMGFVLALPMLTFLALLGLGLAWEPVFAALEGRSLDAGLVVAGVVFLAFPAVLLGAVVLPRRGAVGTLPPGTTRS